MNVSVQTDICSSEVRTLFYDGMPCGGFLAVLNKFILGLCLSGKVLALEAIV